MNIAWTRAADGLARRAFSVDDIQRMMEAGIFSADERFELIDRAGHYGDFQIRLQRSPKNIRAAAS